MYIIEILMIVHKRNHMKDIISIKSNFKIQKILKKKTLKKN